MQKRSLIFLFLTVVLMQGFCISQTTCLSSKQLPSNRFVNLFQRMRSEPCLQRSVFTRQDLKPSLSEVSDSVSDRGYTCHSFSIFVTPLPELPPQILNSMTEEEVQEFVNAVRSKRVDYGLGKMDQHDLRKTLLDIIDTFMINDTGAIGIEIRHMGTYGYLEIFTAVRKEFVDVQKYEKSSREVEERTGYPLNSLDSRYPKTAFDGDGNLSFWHYGYSTQVIYRFENDEDDRERSFTGLWAQKVSYQDKGKELFVADLVNFMFTWIKQGTKKEDTIPLNPIGDVKLKIFVESE